MENRAIQDFKPHFAIFAGMASVAIVLILVVIKTWAYWLSGSISVLASLTDSIVDAMVSLMSLMAIRHSLKPADASHRSGHGKVEGLAALVQSAFIAGAGVFLLLESLHSLFKPERIVPDKDPVVIVVMVVSLILSVVLVAIQGRLLRKAPSLAIKADRAHYSSDIVINSGAIAVLALQFSAGMAWVDPLFALLVALWMFRTAYTIVAQSVDMLLDRELSDDVRAEIIKIVRRHPRVHDLHDLRTSMSGMRMLVSLDIEVDPDISLAEAHSIAKAVESDILDKFPNAEVMIHEDPIGDTDDSRHTVRGVHH